MNTIKEDVEALVLRVVSPQPEQEGLVMRSPNHVARRCIATRRHNDGSVDAPNRKVANLFREEDMDGKSSLEVWPFEDRPPGSFGHRVPSAEDTRVVHAVGGHDVRHSQATREPRHREIPSVPPTMEDHCVRVRERRPQVKRQPADPDRPRRDQLDVWRRIHCRSLRVCREHDLDACFGHSAAPSSHGDRSAEIAGEGRRVIVNDLHEFSWLSSLRLLLPRCSAQVVGNAILKHGCLERELFGNTAPSG